MIARIIGVAFALIAIPIVWLISASYLLLYLGGLVGRVDSPWMAWWTYAWGNPDKWVKLYLAAAALPPTVVLVLIGIVGVRIVFFRQPSRRLRRAPWERDERPFVRGVTNNHGHANWLSPAAAKALFRGPNPAYGGIVVGEDEKGRLLIDPCDTGSGHSLVIAGSGGFKTSSAVSTALTWRGSSVILDPSCEMGPMLAQAMEDDGKRVVMLDPKRPEGAERWGVNVLDWLDTTDDLAPMHVHTVVDWICGESEGRASANDEFFRKGGRDLIACLLAHMLWDDSPDCPPKTLATLRVGLSMPGPELQKILEGIYASSASPMARQLAGPLVGLAYDTFSGMYGNADRFTSWLAVPVFSQLVSGDAFHTANLLRERMTVFVQVPLSALLTSPAVARVIIGALLNAVFVAERQEAQARVLFLLDEAARLGKMKVLEVARDAGRKYGISLHLLYQSSGQIDTIWTRDGRKAWYDGMTWRGYSAVQDIDTAREVSASCGKLAVMAWSEGDSFGRQSGTGRGSRNRGGNVNVHEISRDLIKPEEIMTDIPDDEMIVLARGQRPLRCKRALWFKRSEMASKIEVSRFEVAN